jgi:hypothetical protein
LTVPAAALKFTLADEARWNSSHRTTAYEAGKKLRHMPIQFVSAGQLEGTIKDRPLVAEPAEPTSDSESPAPSSPSSSQDNTDAMAQMAIRSPSPALSDVSSSSDEVVFQGRGGVAVAPAAVSKSTQMSDVPAPVTATATFRPAFVTRPSGSSRAPSPRKKVQDAPASHQRNHHERVPTPSLTATSTNEQTSVTGTDARASINVSLRFKPAPATTVEDVNDDADDADVVVQDHFAKRRGGKPVWEGTTTPWEYRSKLGVGWLPVADRPDMGAFLRGEVNPRDAAMHDYMQNVEEFGLTGEMMGNSGGFASREMGADDSQNEWESDEEQDEDEAAKGSDDWDSDMLQDMVDLSTSSDVEDTVVRILSKRTRQSGLQYLCVYEGSITDDARWLPASFLKSGPEMKLIRIFEEAVEMRELEASESESTDDHFVEDDSTDDDEDLDDEAIARVLQKQEELGLGSDEVLLYAADEYFGGLSSNKASYSGYGKPSKNRPARGRGKRDPTFPSASAMVDALEMDPYGAFDIMDTERPSLKPKKKGRRGQPPPELEDPDLTFQMQNTWEADRAKKRMKKAEREELRQQGLLGRKGKSANLKVKYSGGVDMDDVLEELREFMVGDMQTLSLPPMEAYRRATIHQAASVFGVTSRSRGDGEDRFTILAKTKRTKTYTDAEFDFEIQRKGFIKRLRGPLMSKKGPKPAKASTFRSGNRLRPQVGYQDGDKVGANAPELGPESKGHALMVKMGWSKGMALGTEDNQGILQPISHTVKINKAGLQ